MEGRYKKSGWYNESVRHGLAAKGVKTGRKNYAKIIDKGFMTVGYDDKSNWGAIIEREPCKKAVDIETPEFKKIVNKRIKEHNKNGDIKNVVFSFNTHEEAMLWIDEYTGQISDGKWENSRGSGWRFWTSINVKVDESKPTHIIGKHREGSIHFKFNDLVWLFDKDRGGSLPPGYKKPNPSDVRNVFSKVPTDKIRKYNKSISNAISDYMDKRIR